MAVGRAIFLVAILSIVVVLSIPRVATAQALSKDWTSTNDFDSGTKSSSGGNFEVETNTDNPGINSGQFELGSIKGDAFNFADADTDTFKWHKLEYRGGSNGGGQTFDISTTHTGLLHLRFTTGNANNDSLSIASDVTVSGNLDMILNATRGTPDDGQSFAVLAILNEDVASCLASPTVDGVEYRRGFAGAPLDKVSASTCTNGVLTLVGTDTTTTAGFIRFTRIGTTVTFYYSSDGVSWTQDEQTTFTTTDAERIVISITGNAFRLIHWDYDFFQLSVGTISSGGYRSSGNWFSPVYSVPPAGARVDRVRIFHAGLSATYAIDLVEFYRNNFLEESFPTDIVAGSQSDFIATMLYENNSDFRVKVYLKGDALGTPAILSVQVFLHFPSTAPEDTTNWVLPILMFIFFFAFLAVGAYFRSGVFMLLCTFTAFMLGIWATTINHPLAIPFGMLFIAAGVMALVAAGRLGAEGDW